MFIAVYPPVDNVNPYYNLFYSALNKRTGLMMKSGIYSKKWIDNNRNDIAFVHFHWLACYYDNPSLLISIKRALKLINFVRYVRKNGLEIVWTLHNIMPHEGRSRLLDYVVRFLFSRYSKIIIVHSDDALRKAKIYFLASKHKLVKMYHGNYIDWYKNDVDKDAARTKFGIDRKVFVYLFFGNVRPYKGVESLIESFRKIEFDGDTKLIIAGKPLSDEYGTTIKKLANNDARIEFILQRLDEDELCCLLNAADAAVLPFKNISSSGSLMLFLSFGLPVIVPYRQSIAEYLNDQVGSFYDNGKSLSEVLMEVPRIISKGGLMQRDDIIDYTEKCYRWDLVVNALVDKISVLLNRK